MQRCRPNQDQNFLYGKEVSLEKILSLSKTEKLFSNGTLVINLKNPLSLLFFIHIKKELQWNFGILTFPIRIFQISKKAGMKATLDRCKNFMKNRNLGPHLSIAGV